MMGGKKKHWDLKGRNYQNEQRETAMVRRENRLNGYSVV